MGSIPGKGAKWQVFIRLVRAESNVQDNVERILLYEVPGYHFIWRLLKKLKQLMVVGDEL